MRIWKRIELSIFRYLLRRGCLMYLVPRLDDRLIGVAEDWAAVNYSSGSDPFFVKSSAFIAGHDFAIRRIVEAAAREKK